jgi:ribosomal protein L31E
MKEICTAVIKSRTLEIDLRIADLNNVERSKKAEESLDWIHAQIELKIITDENNELNDILNNNAGSQGLRLADLVIAKSKKLVVENLARVNALSSLDTFNSWYKELVLAL